VSETNIIRYAESQIILKHYRGRETKNIDKMAKIGYGESHILQYFEYFNKWIDTNNEIAPVLLEAK
jgi:hypothetical protein